MTSDDLRRLGLGFLMDQLSAFIGQTILSEQQAAREKAELIQQIADLKKRLEKKTKE